MACANHDLVREAVEILVGPRQNAAELHIFGLYFFLGETRWLAPSRTLATVHRILQRHGGKVWAEGEVGGGAR